MAEDEASPLQATVWYRDAHGYLQELRVSSVDARNIESARRSTRRSEAKWRERHVTFTDLSVKPGQIGESPLPRKDLGNAWEGPRFRFRWLVGESRTWGSELRLWEMGLIEACPICRGAWLPAYAYCLNCDRSGVDAQLTAETEKKKVKDAKSDGLKGGK